MSNVKGCEEKPRTERPKNFTKKNKAQGYSYSCIKCVENLQQIKKGCLNSLKNLSSTR